jgi:hypothetical protein
MKNSNNPKYPLYIVSKGRWEKRLTSDALERMNVPYYIVVEEQEYDNYCSVINPAKVLILPQRYKEEYEVCDDLGLTKSTGPGPARNFAWDHSIENGFARHWVMDDNIYNFQRFNHNTKIRVNSGVCFRVMEDFTDRYENIAMSGPNYHMFVPARQKRRPFIMNTRIYSCNLIKNDTPYRWRGRYNEDTDLSLRMLKDGWCTVQFNAFLQDKAWTQSVKGGNTKEFYEKEGTYPKSEMLVRLHPDVSRLVYKFRRWHHYVDYTPFKDNKLIRKKDIEIKEENNEYGLILAKKNNGE